MRVCVRSMNQSNLVSVSFQGHTKIELSVRQSHLQIVAASMTGYAMILREVF